MDITTQMLIDGWLPIAVFYFVFFWGLPMVGMTTNPYVKEHNCYWKGVVSVAGIFHVSGILAGLLMWYLNPYLFPAQ